jgi:hypothetical protein
MFKKEMCENKAKKDESTSKKQRIEVGNPWNNKLNPPALVELGLGT